MDSSPNQIRFGHALGSAKTAPDDASLKEALDIINGTLQLVPRPPVLEGAVFRAETILAAKPRPIYAYVGDLHPALGRVGLVLSRAWAAASLQGVSRCDSGGLAGRFGGFGCLDQATAESTLAALSTPTTCELAAWEESFDQEVQSSYRRGARGYVEEDQPDISRWPDARRNCIQFATEQRLLDRRLWTWEARMAAPPDSSNVEALILSPESYKRLFHLHGEGIDVPSAVRILGDEIEGVGGEGIPHWFSRQPVRNALLGVP